MNARKLVEDYANVFYEVCSEQGIVSEALYDLQAINDVSNEIKQVLESPIISKNIKHELIDELKNNNFNKETINLLKILIDAGNYALLRMIIEDVQKIFLKNENITIVEITNAKKLSYKKYDELRISLEEKLNSLVIIDFKIKPETIGGMCIKYNGKIIDNTVKKQLTKIQKTFK